MRTHRDLVLDIQKWLSKFAIDFKTQISAKAYEWLECMDQSIDHDLEEIDMEMERPEILAREVVL